MYFKSVLVYQGLSVATDFYLYFSVINIFCKNLETQEAKQCFGRPLLYWRKIAITSLEFRTILTRTRLFSLGSFLIDVIQLMTSLQFFSDVVRLL